MAQIRCGSVIHRLGVPDDPGTAGCLVRFPEDPDKLFWLTAGHVLVGREAKQFDRVEAKDLPGQTIGMLFGWTGLNGDVTVDAALVWVNPALVLPEIGQLGVPQGINTRPEEGARLRIFAMGEERVGTIQELARDVPIRMVGPDFEQQVTYRNQIVCSSFSMDGCSGAVAIDDEGFVVGMVVGGDGVITLVTPIDEILSHRDWGPGAALEIIGTVPPTATAPLMPVPRPPPAPAPSGQIENALRAALRFNEIGDKSPYVLSFAKKGTSGGSFGFMQGDLAAGQPIVQSTFRGVLTAAGVPANQIKDLARRLSVHLLHSPLDPAERELINTALNSPAGREFVDAMDAAIFADVCRHLDRCMTAAESSRRTITPEAQIKILLWINMSGPPTILLDWLSGHNVDLFKGTVIAPGPRVDGAAVERYLERTKFFVENRENLQHFREAVGCGVALLGPTTTPAAAANLNTARVDQSALSLPGIIRNQPIAAELEALLIRAASSARINIVRITSGGQPGSSGQRRGSTRHDGGRAADLELIVDGRALTFTDRDAGSLIKAFITAAAAEGATGIGAGERYMGTTKMHVGFGKTADDSSKVVWGAGGSSATAPNWLRRAAQEGWQNPLPPPPGADGETAEENLV